MRNGQIHLGVVGAGYWGPNLVRSFVTLPDVQVAWVCDKKAGRRRYIVERFPNIAVTEKYEDVLADPEVSAVVIATPVSTHYRLAMAALNAGKHVMIEKPMADTVERAERIVAAARRTGLVVTTDHLFVYNPAVSKMKELVEEGSIGSLCYAESSRVNLGPPGSEVDVIWDLATHDISITYYLWGRLPAEVVAYGQRFLHPKLIDVAFIHLRFQDGTMAVHHVSWLSPEKVRRFFLAGTTGSFIFDDSVPDTKLRQIDQGLDSRIGLEDDDVRELFYRPGTVSYPELDPVEPLLASCRDFVDCVRARATPRADGHAGLAVVRILDAAERSIDQGSCPVPL